MRHIKLNTMVSTLDSALLHLPVLLNGLSPSSLLSSTIVYALLDSGAALNLIHERLVQNLNLESEPCSPVRVTIANGDTMSHSNRQVRLKFAIHGVLHQETFLVAPIGENSMILGMPWFNRVNPNINWKLRQVSTDISPDSTTPTPSLVPAIPPTLRNVPKPTVSVPPSSTPTRVELPRESSPTLQLVTVIDPTDQVYLVSINSVSEANVSGHVPQSSSVVIVGHADSPDFSRNGAGSFRVPRFIRSVPAIG